MSTSKRYFFHLLRNGALVSDLEGSVFPSFEDAQDYALRSARELIAHKVLAGEVIQADSIEITDGEGLVELVLPLKTVVVFEDPSI